MSLTRGPAIDSHPVSGVVPQYQEEQAATLPGNEFPWHGVRLQEGYCYPLSSETAVLCCLSQSLHPQGSEGLEGLPQTHGPYGSNGTDSPSGPSSHAPCSEVSPECRPVSTEPHPCQGDGFPKALQSPTLVEGPSQHQERADHGVSDSPPDRIYRRIPSRLGSRTQRSGYQRTLEGPLGVSAYKLVGAEGGLSSPKALSTDSTVTAAYINRQGGLGSPTLCKLATALWLWAHPQFSSLRAVHVPGPLNVAADMLSRGGPSPGEWRLHPQVVEGIWSRFGRAEVDLFATRESSHCPRFFSLRNDDPPLGWDALAQSWPQTLLYAFPPFTLLQALLHRVQMEQVRLILVAPFWPHMSWFSMIPTLLEGQPWMLPLRGDLLSQAGGKWFHTFPAGLRLVAWPLRWTGSWP